jgi:HlyD family secretion protein
MCIPEEEVEKPRKALFARCSDGFGSLVAAMKVLSPHPVGTNGPGLVRPARPPGPSRRRVLIAFVILAAFAAGALALWNGLRPRIAYATAAVVRKDLLQTVTATGTVNPQNTILVGSQVSGTITEQDADYNSVVRKGQILTRLDPTSFRAALANAVAAEAAARNTSVASLAGLASAQQNALAARDALASARSQVAKARAALDLANVTLQRDRALLAQGYVPQQQVDTDVSNAAAARAAYDAAVIAVPQAAAALNASIAQAQGAQASAAASRQAVAAQRAVVATARYNLDQTVIRSQVKGTVIARNITIGQTVAASFQTPTLFTLGQDLTKMEVDVAVGEPDIGGVRAGQIADFTVLAYPNRTFHGYVYQVRQNPTTINNVVTYDTVVYVDNNDGALYPGMTANASIHVAKANNALVVPISALQYAPPQAQGAAAPGSSGTSPWGTTQASLTRTIIAGRAGRLYVLRNANLARVPVRILLVSGTEAAVMPVGAALGAGDRVVTSDSESQMATQQNAPSSTLTTGQPSYGRTGGGPR